MAHKKDSHYESQIENPHSKMRGHQNDIHLRSKTADSGHGGKGTDRNTAGVSGGIDNFHPGEAKIVRYDHLKKGHYKAHEVR